MASRLLLSFPTRFQSDSCCCLSLSLFLPIFAFPKFLPFADFSSLSWMIDHNRVLNNRVYKSKKQLTNINPSIHSMITIPFQLIKTLTMIWLNCFFLILLFFSLSLLLNFNGHQLLRFNSIKNNNKFNSLLMLPCFDDVDDDVIIIVCIKCEWGVGPFF